MARVTVELAEFRPRAAAGPVRQQPVAGGHRYGTADEPVRELVTRRTQGRGRYLAVLFGPVRRQGPQVSGVIKVEPRVPGGDQVVVHVAHGRAPTRRRTDVTAGARLGPYLCVG